MTDYERHATLLTALESAIDIATHAAEINDIRGVKGMELRRKLRLLRQYANYERERLNEEMERMQL